MAKRDYDKAIDQMFNACRLDRLKRADWDVLIEILKRDRPRKRKGRQKAWTPEELQAWREYGKSEVYRWMRNIEVARRSVRDQIETEEQYNVWIKETWASVTEALPDTLLDQIWNQFAAGLKRKPDRLMAQFTGLVMVVEKARVRSWSKRHKRWIPPPGEDTYAKLLLDDARRPRKN